MKNNVYVKCNILLFMFWTIFTIVDAGSTTDQTPQAGQISDSIENDEVKKHVVVLFILASVSSYLRRMRLSWF